jgi:LmbE family N-acetylglucosaminyl deacetylase
MFQNEHELYPYSVTDFSAKDALVLAPHPDDETLGCGGSIIKHVKAGSRVKILFMTDGNKGDFEARFGKDYVNMRRHAARQSMAILGVQDYEFWGFEDRGLYEVSEDILRRLEGVIGAFSPALIYTPSPYEAHPDHRALSKIAMVLFEQTGIQIIFYEVLMALYPNMLVDITLEMERKKEAIESYHTEIYYNDYVKKIESLNKFRTSTLPKSISFAEGFVQLDRKISDTGLSLKLLSELLNI